MPRFALRGRFKARYIIYWCRIFLRWKELYVEFLGAITRFMVTRAFGGSSFAGIQIVVYPPVAMDSRSDVVQALELVRLRDPRRFRRIERFVQSIVVANWNPKNAGKYRRLGQVVQLTNFPVPSNTRFIAAYAYAQTLVHEATHGVLEAKRFAYVKRNRPRIEKLCQKEEIRFTLKVAKADMEKWRQFRDFLSSRRAHSRR